jgi:hypothetical protein
MHSNFTNVTKRPLTRKQKLLWGAVILVVFLYFNPSILRPVFGAFTSGGQHKPSPNGPRSNNSDSGTSRRGVGRNHDL